MDSKPPIQPDVQLKQILVSLEGDPLNASLLSNAALLAFDAGELSLCRDLVERLATVTPISGPLQNLRGLLAIAHERFGDKDR
jgi:hypothetical protein